MKVALIYFRENFTPAPPMGLVYLGTVLEKAGYEVMVVDSFPGFNEINIEKVCAFNPDLIGISVLTTGHQIASKYTKILKDRLRGTLLCWGGVHPTSIPFDILASEKAVDFVVVGEGEETILEVCNTLASSTGSRGLSDIKGVIFRDNGEIIDNGKREFVEDLDNLPIPDRGLLRTPRYSWYMSPPGIIRGQFLEGITTIYTSRGCPYNCIFCCSHETAGRKLRQRSVENVLEEIRYLWKDYRIKGLYFNDDTFGLDKDWTDEFCAALRQEKYKLVWGCQTRAHLVDKKFLAALKSAGCVQVDIGCESGSNKVLRNLQKGITVEQILNAFQCAKEVGIDTYATFILGSPGETLGDVKKTEKVAKMINSRVNFLLMVPYPGSKMFEMAKENGWLIDKELHFSENWTNKQSENPVMEINFKSKDLLRMRAKLQNRFFWKNNLKTAFSFAYHPLYILRMIFVLIRYPGTILAALSTAIKERKFSILIETVYQKYNEVLMVSASH